MTEKTQTEELPLDPSAIMGAGPSNLAPTLLEAINSSAALDSKPVKLKTIKIPGGVFGCEIDPDTALAMLRRSADGRNRKVSEPKIRAYARAYKTPGRWRYPAQPILIDSDGRVLDGQHRLFAVVLSGCTVKFIVIQCGDVESTTDRARMIEVLDSGLSRKPWDMLGDLGRERYQAMLLVLALEDATSDASDASDDLDHRGASISQLSRVIARVPSTSVLAAVRANSKLLRDACEAGKTASTQLRSRDLRVPAPALSAGLFLIARDGLAKGEKFIKDFVAWLAGAADMDEPTFHRELAAGLHQAALAFTGRTRSVSVMASLLRGFDASRSNLPAAEVRKAMAWSPTDPFPVIAG